MTPEEVTIARRIAWEIRREYRRVEGAKVCIWQGRGRLTPYGNDPGPPFMRDGVRYCPMVCEACGRIYTSEFPPVRVESRMHCFCGGPVCLLHQRD